MPSGAAPATRAGTDRASGAHAIFHTIGCPILGRIA